MTTTGRTAPSGRRVTMLAAGALAAAALIAGCGSSGGGSSSSTMSSGSQTQATTLMTEHNGTLGTLVTDGQGFTLYRFDQDTNNPSATHCTGDCATLWPPELTTGSGAPALKGIDAKLVSTVTRPDGTHQVTLNGWPLYRYTPDTKPGQTNGQGVGGTWWATTPTGDKAMPMAGSGPSMPSGGGY
ncbi:hypothetical protein ACFYS8_26740 [Kitasatospora sp. NPDC004615]|uniref:hypothetical protein n=1 Tax=Kitasatospora sp. NPDC004615 TaxID=3364017 RepID=UPI003679EDDB